MSDQRPSPLEQELEAEKWTYQRPERKKQQKVSLSGAMKELFRHLVLFVVFALSPVLVLTVLYWICAKIFADTYIREVWMQPVILLVSAFIAGIINRQIIEEFIRSMSLFIVAILGLAAFAYLCWLDIQQAGALFSTRILPETLRYGMMIYLYSIPLTGIAGMFTFKWFNLKP